MPHARRILAAAVATGAFRDTVRTNGDTKTALRIIDPECGWNQNIRLVSNEEPKIDRLGLKLIDLCPCLGREGSCGQSGSLFPSSGKV
ncbi:hypothetical protein ZHAS_00011405 [Anopheles sinensis]|uniref:Uncharacterized protein n=1 Tax=Anopheles sinensis TaxID=74873 RepID=A0A084W0D3_ANOSI|nr:hypothetical protein ZHAS_00011405 [Anopheles sinensis]